MVTKENPKDITMVILNRKDKSPQKPTLTQQDIHIVWTIPFNAFKYAIEVQWPTYYNQLEPSLTTTNMHT